MKKLLFSLALLTAAVFSLQAQTGNVGIGTNVPGSKLTVNGSFAATYKNVSASATLGVSDFYVAYSGAANGTLTLPAATAAAPAAGNIQGRVYHFKNTSSSTLTIAASGTELIDNQAGAGVATVTMPPGTYAMFISKGTTTGTTWEVSILHNTFGTALYLSATANTTVTPPGINPVILSNVIYNSGDFSFAPATGIITVNKAGIYVMTFQTSWVNIIDGQQLTAGITDANTGQWIGRSTHYAARATPSTTVGEALYMSAPITVTAGQQLRYGVASGQTATIIANETGASGTGVVTSALLQKIN